MMIIMKSHLFEVEPPNFVLDSEKLVVCLSHTAKTDFRRKVTGLLNFIREYQREVTHSQSTQKRL